MSKVEICRIAGGTLVLLIGIALGFGGLQLWRGGPAAWPDVIARAATVKRISGGMIVSAVVFLITAIAVLTKTAWGGPAAAIAILLLVAAAFWVNYRLFGDIRLVHTGTNVLVAGLILVLLWIGYSGHTHGS